MKTRFVSFLSLLIGFSIISCTQSGVGPPDLGGLDFSLALEVVDINGGPVGGLVISPIHDITPSFAVNAKKAPPSLQKTQAVTVIQFEVPTVAHVILRAYDFQNRLVSTIVDLGTAPAGRHSAQFILMDQKGTQIYKCILIATDTASGATLFRDSIYAVLWQPDYALCSIGVTSANGTFQTRDSLHFPNVLSHPPFVLTNSEGPARLGTFQISDSVNIVLADTSLRRTQTYLCTVKRGQNNLRLTWNPGSNDIMRNEMPGRTVPASVRHRESTPSALEWKLEQNYPNPFL